MRLHAAFLLRRSGVYLNRARRSVWVHGGIAEDFEAARVLLSWLRTGVSTERLLLTSDRPLTCEWLKARYPNDNALPVPFALRPVLARFFLQLCPALIILIGDQPRVSRLTLAYAAERGIAVIQIDASAPSPHLIPYVNRFCVRTAEVAEGLVSRGVAADRVHVTGPLRVAGKEQGISAVATIHVLESAIGEIPTARDPMPDRTAPRRIDRLARTTLGRAIVANRARRGIVGWDALRERLRNPEMILCVGNGPSCEDTRLLELRYESLFRVNWRWFDRGVLTRPDMVFVGDLRTTARVSGCVFGFRTIAWESEVLLRHLLLNLRPTRIEYFTFERVSPLLSDDRWPALPTNGIVLVATAVGLRPKRIIIAGMDLYSDPRGRYPGDIVSDNNYPQMHSRAVEVRVLNTVLSNFAGEVTILSESLRRALGLPSAV